MTTRLSNKHGRATTKIWAANYANDANRRKRSHLVTPLRVIRGPEIFAKYKTCGNAYYRKTSRIGHVVAIGKLVVAEGHTGPFLHLTSSAVVYFPAAGGAS